MAPFQQALSALTALIMALGAQVGNLNNVVNPSHQVAQVPLTVQMGETSVFGSTDSGNGNLLLVQDATLSQPATVQSISFYVFNPSGNLRLGIYDATGANGGPGALKAETASLTPTAGWNIGAVTAPVYLPAGNYWLAYLPSSNTLSFATNFSTGSYKYASYTFGAMPATFPAVSGQGTTHWSLYATLSAGSGSADTQNPTAPTNLSATAVSSSQINLSWTASTDDVGVVSYKIYRNGTEVGTSASNSYTDYGLLASTAYSYYVVAYDTVQHPSSNSQNVTATTQTASSSGNDRFLFLNYEGTSLPKTDFGGGDIRNYPYQAEANGAATTNIDTTQKVLGNQSAKLTLTNGNPYPTWSPFNYGTLRNNVLSPRGFAREYADNPTGWKFNTYNRLSFWMRVPTNGSPMSTVGNEIYQLGVYNKQVTPSDAYDWLHQDEYGGNHYYHFLNVPPTGTWTKIILNMHPNHQRGATSGSIEWGNQPYPTCSTSKRPDGAPLGWNYTNGLASECGTYNYWDTFTNFYIENVHTDPTSYPVVYNYDDFEFYREPYVENDEQVYNIQATYVPTNNRIILNWSRNKNEDTIKHEVRYSFADIHQSGWGAATAAPNGIITPQGYQMLYDTTAIPTSGQSVIYLAIKPQNSSLFSQISIPLSGTPSPVDSQAPSIPANLSATAVSTSQINLTWNPSTDNVGVAGYRVYRGTTQVATVPNSSYSDTGLSAGTTYTYKVAAYDSALNISGQSLGATATTQSDPVVPPVTPPSTKFTSGQKIQTTDALNVRDAASINGTLLGTQAAGSIGTILSGGQYADGYYWWNVNFNSGVDGYVVENYLTLYTDPVTPPPPVTPFSKLIEMESMSLTSSLSKGTDSAASAGGYISAVSGSVLDTPAREASVSVSLPSATNYYVWARVLGPDGNSDASFVGIDSTWDRVYPQTTGAYEWVKVENGINSGNYAFNLASGSHTLQAGHSELNARLDALYISTDANAVPPAPTPVVIPPSTKFTSGQKIQTTDALNVRDAASINGTLLGTQAAGSIGTILSGGQYADGYYWWNVNFNSGVDGYVVENYLTLYTDPVTPPVTTKFQMGDRVHTTAKLKVRQTPSSSGRAICTQPRNAYGTIMGGPQTANGYIWWQVNYDSLCDGWSVQDWLTK